MDRYEDDEPLTVPEVASWLRISRSQVYDLMQRGQLDSIRIGSCRRIMARTVRAYLGSLQGAG